MSAKKTAGRTWAWAGGAALVCGAAGLWWWAASAGVVPGLNLRAALGPGAAPAALLGASPERQAAGAEASASGALATGQRVAGQPISVEALRMTGSLRGTELDGDWGQFPGGVLVPDLRLRQRFDHLLIGLGEVDPAALRAWIGEQVRAAHGDKEAQQVLAVWDAYVALLQSEVGGQAADPTDAAAWQRWIAQRSAARSAAMGPGMAHAFFAEEHQQLRDFGDRMVQRASAPPGALEPEQAAQIALLPSAAALPAQAIEARQAQRIQYFGAEGAQRLQEEDKAWADWNRRIEAARERHREIAADPNLSEPQRKAALETELASRFQGTDLLRAKGLVREQTPMPANP